MLRDMATKQIKLNFSFFSNAYLFTAETLKENCYSFLFGMKILRKTEMEREEKEERGHYSSRISL